MLLWALPLSTLAEQPTTVPADDSATTLRAWMNDLANMDESIRERARVDLMGLGRNDLPLLKRVVADLRPLQASQSSVLRDIVLHVYLTGEPYDIDGFGFLGVVLPTEDRAAINEEGESPVIIMSRLPGFAAYRMLQDGDVITEIKGRFPTRLRNKFDLITAIGAKRVGEVVHLGVLRQGQLLDIPVKLSGRPVEVNAVQAAGQVEQIKNLRQNKADKYWAENFEPLLDQRVSTTGN